MCEEYTLVHIDPPDMQGRFPGDPGCDLCRIAQRMIPERYLRGDL